MKRLLGLSLAALACLAVVASQVNAMRIAPPAVPVRVATADVVVVGKVTGFGPKLVDADMFKGDKRQMQIATVKVDETLLGKGVKEIKVGFFPPPAVRPGPPFIIRKGGGNVQLTVGQEAALFLQKHPTKDVYTVSQYFDVINKKGNPGFAAELTEIKKYVKLLADPKKGLESKNAEDRFTTAAMLVARYRRPRGNNKTEDVPAEESKQILLALADADWAPKAGPRFGFGLNPQMSFFQLGLQPKDGWTQPKDFRTFPEEARKWLKANAGKYRIQRYVGTKIETPADPNPSSDK
jgi:hypothetical protein